MDLIENHLFSFDSNKVNLCMWGNDDAYLKNTNIEEYNNYIYAKNFFSNKKIKISGEIYDVSVPILLFWDYQKSIMITKKVNATNLEFILRDDDIEKRKYGLLFLDEILSFILSNNFYWVDFAPRNILISDKKIFILDFEKGCTATYDSIKKFLRNHVYEEYASFILPEERKIDSNWVFEIDKNEKNIKFKVDDIKSKRMKFLVREFGYTGNIFLEEYYSLMKILIDSESPFEFDNKIIFPRLLLHDLLENDCKSQLSYRKYARTIVQLYNAYQKVDKVNVLKKIRGM